MTKSREDVIRDSIRAMVDNNTITLPSVPNVIIHINQAIDNENKSITDIAKLVQNDITLCSRVLQISNSPALRGNTRIMSIKDAIIRIGLTMVKNIVIAISLRDSFKSKNEALNELLVKIFKHSVMMSHIAYRLSKDYKELGLNYDLVNLAGILFNLGKLPVISYFERSTFSSIEEVEQIANTLRTSINELVLTKWDVSLGVGTAVCRQRIETEVIDEGNILLIIDAFLKNDPSLIPSGVEAFNSVWEKLEAHRDDYLKSAGDIQQTLLG